ncbi:Cell wall protein PRY3 [Pleurostoma richardsiae]|uniref:Cell wall protein PRY3 n=1 Tax=Pleurostoma richardsiae TaxID=41990 RepID=A0AA38R6N3_9PEZI|nr:Cell wall protein PRY3 [Pleurostoma richardsiae]
MASRLLPHGPHYLLFLLLVHFSTIISAAPSPDTVTITAAPSIPSTAPQFVSESLFTSAILNSTNFFRTEHNASAVRWNHTLETFASDYLDGAGCDFAHSGGPYGENLAIGCSDAAGCVDAWGDEREEYDFGDPGFSEDTGHFTQLVWKNTTTVGCGRRLCGTSGWYLVCEYWPRGNVIGEFKEEVGKQVNGTGSGGGAVRPPSVSAAAFWMLIASVALLFI